MPKLYIAEMELSHHSVNRHILPQLGNFISFIQTNISSEITKVRAVIYDDLKANKDLFKQIQTDTRMEVYELIQTALEDLQILLVIDRIPTDLMIGLSQIEKAINVKIRKIELVRYKESADSSDELISYFDNESIYEDDTTTDNEVSISESGEIQYTLDYHLNGKSEDIVQLFNNFVALLKDKLLITPKKLYISLANQNIILSLVVMTKKIIVYSKEPLEEIGVDYQSLTLRDVTNIGHYCSHLPTEIKVDGSTDFELLKKYVLAVIEKYGGELKGVDNSGVLDGE